MGRQVGQFIREARESVGISQADLANKLGLKSAQSISNIERGVAPLPQAMIPRISTLLKVDRVELVEVIVEEVRQKYLGIVKGPRKKPYLPVLKKKLSRA